MQPLFTKLANLLQNSWQASEQRQGPLARRRISDYTNEEVRVTKFKRMITDQMKDCRGPASWSYSIRPSFVIARTVFLVLIVQMCCSTVVLAQTPNMTGTWNVEITFANAHHSLRLEAQDGGKGSLQLTDPAAKVWTGAKPSEAKWSREEGNSVMFSGPVEFMLGNVGRDAGTLTCKGKFETADLISGEVEFSPSVGERPSKHGTFKATRTAR